MCLLRTVFAVACSVTLLAPLSIRAQEVYSTDSSAQVVVRTTDGNRITGRYISQDSATVVLETTDYGRLNIRRPAVKSMRKIRPPKMVKGKAWYESGFSNCYFAGTSAYGLEKGEAAFDNAFLLFNQVSYGFSNNFSLGAGIAPFVILDGPMPVWITPKFSIPIKPDKVNLGISGFYGRSFYSYASEDPNYGAAYAQLTLGSRDQHFTAGFGYIYSAGRWIRPPAVSLSGYVRIGPHLGLLAESYFLSFDERLGLFAGGARFIFRSFALDTGFVLATVDGEGPYFLPWISGHVAFGNSR